MEVSGTRDVAASRSSTERVATYGRDGIDANVSHAGVGNDTIGADGGRGEAESGAQDSASGSIYAGAGESSSRSSDGSAGDEDGEGNEGGNMFPDEDDDM